MAVTQSSIQVIDRCVSLLDTLAAAGESLSLKLLCAETGLHPSTAFRILDALKVHGLVERDAAGRYRLGGHLHTWRAGVAAGRDVRREALPVMEALRDEVGETVNLTVREGDQVVYVERAVPARMMRVEQVIGSRAPLHVTAVGKLMLAEEGETGIRLYAQRTGLPRYTPNTLTLEQALMQSCLLARTQGYACDDEEAEVGVGCIGVLIHEAGGAIAAGLSISAPIERRRQSWVPLLQAAAQRVAARLGG